MDIYTNSKPANMEVDRLYKLMYDAVVKKTCCYLS